MQTQRKSPFLLDGASCGDYGLHHTALAEHAMLDTANAASRTVADFLFSIVTGFSVYMSWYSCNSMNFPIQRNPLADGEMQHCNYEPSFSEYMASRRPVRFLYYIFWFWNYSRIIGERCVGPHSRIALYMSGCNKCSCTLLPLPGYLNSVCSGILLNSKHTCMPLVQFCFS